MVEKWFRSKPKSASAERCLRSLGAMKPIAASEMELSNRSIVCVTGVLSHCGLRKANCKMGVVTGIRSLPGIAAYGVVLGHFLFLAIQQAPGVHAAAQPSAVALMAARVVARAAAVLRDRSSSCSWVALCSAGGS